MKDIIIIDIEASGLDFESYPIEIAILLNNQCYSWLIKPQKNWLHWPESAEAMHGISRQSLFDQGIQATQVAQEINKALQTTNGVLYSDAAYWDADWIETLYLAVKSEKQFQICSIYDLLDKQQVEKFSENKAQLANSDKYREHRAGEDVKMIYEAYLTTVR